MLRKLTCSAKCAIPLVLALVALIGGCGKEPAPPAGGGTSQTDGSTGTPADSNTGGSGSTATNNQSGSGGFSNSDLFVSSPTDTDNHGGTSGTGPATGGTSPVAAPGVAPPKAVSNEKFVTLYEDRTTKQTYFATKYSDDTMRLHGPFVEYHQNGNKFCEGNYADGSRNGHWTFWHPNGNVAKEGDYILGNPDGHWVVKRADGSMEREEHYRNGQKHGHWTYYGGDGTSVVRREEFSDNQADGTWAEWYPSGQKKVEVQFRDGLLHGKRVIWHENGQVASEENFKDNKRHGRYVSYSQDGIKINDFQYVDGRRQIKSSSG